MKGFIKNFSQLLIFLLFQQIYSGIIIPDPANPLLVFRPNKDQLGQSILITFSLPNTSVGLGFRQYITIQFPKVFQMDLALDQTSKNGSPISPRF